MKVVITPHKSEPLKNMRCRLPELCCNVGFVERPLPIFFFAGIRTTPVPGERR
jgi:hypothetical protein